MKPANIVSLKQLEYRIFVLFSFLLSGCGYMNLSVKHVYVPGSVSNLSVARVETNTQMSPVIQWSPPSDQTSIDHYELALGTSPGATDVAGWTNAGTATSYQFSGLNLTNGQTYYPSIRTVDAYGTPSDVFSGTSFTVVTDSPSLDLNFLTGSLPSTVRFTRIVPGGASAGTYFDSSGVLRSASVDNELLQSQALDNAIWSKSNMTVSTSGEVAAPDDSISAEKLVESSDASAQIHQVSQNVSATVGQAWTISVYAQAAQRSEINLVLLNQGASGNYVSALFNLSGSGTVVSTSAGGNGSGALGTIQALSNGWYRCILTGTPDTSGTTIEAEIQLASSGSSSYIGDGTSGLYAWGAQLEPGLSATQYLYTTSYPSAGPRFSYDPSNCTSGSCSPRGLLIEQSDSNEVLYSSDLSNAAWSQQASLSVTANTNTAPDATNSAATLDDSNSTGQSYLAQTVPTSDGIFSAWTASVFILKDSMTSRFPALELDFTGGTTPVTATVYLDTQTGAVSSPDSASYFGVENDGNYWRLWVTGLNNTSGNTNVAFQMYPAAGSQLGVADPTATGSIVAWGAQLESYYQATSYIPTTSSAVNRYTDTATVPSITSWYDANKGTFVANFFLQSLMENPNANQPPFSLDDGTMNNCITGFVSGLLTNGKTDMYRPLVQAGGSNMINAGGSNQNIVPPSPILVGQVSSIASAYQLDDFAVSYNGLTPDTSSALTSLPSSPTELSIGTLPGAGQPLDGFVQSIQYYPTRLDNDAIMALTSN